jgi:hypothetical protein
VIRSALAALAALVLLAGCGSFGAGGGEGTATLWVTRDRGAEVLLDTQVDAGQTLMRALASKADVETRYGGRFVQAIDGLAGSLEDQRDWFWFVNGYEGDRSASSYRLRDGDVAWLDYRGWEREGEARSSSARSRSRSCTATREDAARGRPLRGLARACSELGRGSAPTRSSRSARPPPRRERARAPRRAAAATAELLGESAGDPVRLVLSGDPTSPAGIEVR